MATTIIFDLNILIDRRKLDAYWASPDEGDTSPSQALARCIDRGRVVLLDQIAKESDAIGLQVASHWSLVLSEREMVDAVAFRSYGVWLPPVPVQADASPFAAVPAESTLRRVLITDGPEWVPYSLRDVTVAAPTSGMDIRTAARAVAILRGGLS